MRRRPLASRRGPEPLGAHRSRRQRLDQLLVERGLVESRSRAQALLLAGRVRVGPGDAARRDLRPGDLVDAAVELVVAEPQRYVSRGGEKLAGALDAFGVDPGGRVCLDVGASTGGFTDCLLQRGARRVYALDVGRGQLADALRVDGRVVSMERTHAARLDPEADGPPDASRAVDLAVADVSFISLTRLLAACSPARRPAATCCPWSSRSSSWAPGRCLAGSCAIRRRGATPWRVSASTQRPSA